jgi:hypothetical protein
MEAKYKDLHAKKKTTKIEKTGLEKNTTKY